MASYGHIRDLPSSASEIPAKLRSKSWARLAVDTEKDFEPVYVVPKESTKRVKELRDMVRSAEELILATDEDREGESISWHLLEVLTPDVPVRRITFHEITRSAIQHALAEPRDVDTKLVRAQEARRVLDRLFGYSLSPVLWKKIRTKLSAGRVQSAALRLIVECEEERAGVPVVRVLGCRGHDGLGEPELRGIIGTGGLEVDRDRKGLRFLDRALGQGHGRSRPRRKKGRLASLARHETPSHGP